MDSQTRNLLLFVGATALLVYVLPRFLKMGSHKPTEVALEPPKPPQIWDVKLHGGPHDGHTDQVAMDIRPHFFITPYTPTDEEGNPLEENYAGTLKDERGEVHFFLPSIAYYQQVTEEDYFFVRDISEAEMRILAMTGKLPEARPHGEETDEA